MWQINFIKLLNSMKSIVVKSFNNKSNNAHSDNEEQSHIQYEYCNPLIDIPYEVIMGSEDNFLAWQTNATLQFQNFCNNIPLSEPLDIQWFDEEEIIDGSAMQYSLKWQPDNPLYGSAIGGSIVFPKKRKIDTPVVVFLHGHGMVSGGNEKGRLSLFCKDGPAHHLIKNGYIVWAPDNVYHDELMSLHKEHDFPLMWGKVAAFSRFYIAKYLQSMGVFQPFVLMGVAAGGHTALVMQAYSSDYAAFISSGSFFPLELLRRDFRIVGHPNCFDFRNYVSYLPIFLLCIKRPMQIQMGKQDPLWIGNALPAQGDWFSGTKRGVFAEEIVGGILIAKHLVSKYPDYTNRFSFHLHNGGHTDIDIEKAIEFVIDKKEEDG